MANHAFRVVLGAEIRVLEARGLLEHVFPENSLVKPGGRDGAHVVKAFSLDRLGKLDGMPGAFNICRLLGRCISLEVIDGAEVEEVMDLAFERKGQTGDIPGGRPYR